jgi:hypothetical protein
MDNRGVSEVLGFVLVFSMITATVALVYVSGLPALEERRDAERVDNAERAFDVFADNVNDIYQGNAPSRATEIRLADARLAFGAPTTMRVNVTNLSPTPVYEASFRPIIYSAGTGTEIAYEGGAVIRADPGNPENSIVKRDPPMVFANDGGNGTALIPFLGTRPTGNSSAVGGSTTVLVRTVGATPTVENVSLTDGPYTLNYTIETTSERANAWRDFFDEEVPASLKEDCPATGTPDGVVACEIEVDRLIVTATGIDVAFN